MFSDFLQVVGRLVMYFSIFDLLDIIIVSFLFYYLIVFIRDTRALSLVKGVAVVLVAYLIASWLNLTTLSYIIQFIINNGIMAIIIIFHPELRNFLERMGRGKFNSLFSIRENGSEGQLSAINGIVEAFRTLREQKMGALVVLECEDNLNDIAATGTIVDAFPAAELISNIFFNKAPLHDGAMIIRDGRVYAAGCILPLTQNNNISMALGTRHRAAIGMSENSDAIVLVVSEETGTLSIAIKGNLQRYETISEFTSALMLLTIPEDEAKKSKLHNVIISEVKSRFSSIKGKKAKANAPKANTSEDGTLDDGKNADKAKIVDNKPDKSDNADKPTAKKRKKRPSGDSQDAGKNRYDSTSDAESPENAKKASGTKKAKASPKKEQRESDGSNIADSDSKQNGD